MDCSILRSEALHSRSPTTTQNTASLQQLNSLPQNGVFTNFDARASWSMNLVKTRLCRNYAEGMGDQHFLWPGLKRVSSMHPFQLWQGPFVVEHFLFRPIQSPLYGERSVGAGSRHIGTDPTQVARNYLSLRQRILLMQNAENLD